MSVERETELKFLLREEAFHLLLERLGKPRKCLKFVNQYYSVIPSLERRDWVLRCRKFESKRVLTLKVGREVQPGVFDSTEYSDNVDSGNPSDWENASVMKTFREQISTQPIQLQGAVNNERIVFDTPLGFGQFWELDRTEYPKGSIVHELEVEVPFVSTEELELRSRQIADYLSEAGVKAEPSRRTKYARFLQSLHEV